MELTVVLAGIPVRLSLRSPAYAACFQPFRTEADPVAAVRVPEDALKEAAPHYEAGTTPEQVEYLELGPRVCDALLPYGRILFHGAAIVWRGRAWIFTANSGTGKTTQYMLWKLCFGSEIKILNGDKPLLEFRKDGILVHPSPWRGKEGLGSLDTAPLGGIILLEQNEENRMRRLLPAEAAGPLLTQLLFTRKNADDVRAACALEERLLAQVPVWLLQNRGDAASAALCRDTPDGGANMTYTLQKDVALVTVCDEHFLVAAGQARGKVPAVKGINRPGAYFWNLLQQKLPENDILRHTAADYHIPIEKAAQALRRFAALLAAEGYLTMAG